MDKITFRNRIYDIYNNEYADYKVLNTFNELKDYLQDKKSYREFVDMLEGVYEDFYDTILENSDSTLEYALKDLYEDTISNNEEDIPVKFTSSYELNSDKCEFTVHGISFFDKDFLDTAIEKLL